MKHFIRYWLPPIAFMAVIFFMSSRQRIAVSDVYTVNFALFKSLHVIEYAALYFLFFRAFYASISKNNLSTIFLLAACATLAYAVTDELHQTFIPTRNGAYRDIFIDSIGIFLCFEYTKNNLTKLKRFL